MALLNIPTALGVLRPPGLASLPPTPGSTVQAASALICLLPPSSHGWPAGPKGPVFVLPGAPPPVLAVVVVGAGVTLAAQPRGLLAGLRLIVPQHISGLCTWGQRQGSAGQGGGRERGSHWEGSRSQDFGDRNMQGPLLVSQCRVCNPGER